MPIPEITRAARFVSLANGGVFAGALITTIATLLSNHSNDALQKLKDGEYAKERMEYARHRTEDQRRIKEANSSAELADLKTQMLSTKLRQALVRQEHLEGANRELSTSLEHEHQQRLLLEAKLSPRHLLDNQAQTMTRLLLPFRGTGIGFTRIQDPEAWKFAEEMFRPLYFAGWHLTDNEVGVFAPPQYGVLLWVPEHLRSDPAAVALAGALQQAGIAFSVQVGGDELRLVVGLNPAKS